MARSELLVILRADSSTPATTRSGNAPLRSNGVNTRFMSDEDVIVVTAAKNAGAVVSVTPPLFTTSSRTCDFS